MKRISLIVCLVLVVFTLSACGPTMVSKKDAFPKMYEERPVSVLVLPPINQTTAADAKEYYATTVAEPLSFTGHYIYPVEVTNAILKAEGIYDTERLAEVPPQKFREYFGSDAVLYVKLLRWDTTYLVLAGNVTVGVDLELKSAVTGDVIWQYKGELKVDTTGDSFGAGGWAGLIVKAVSTAIKTATQDYVPVAKRVNYMTVASMPFGKYHPLHGKDQDLKIIKQTPQQKQ